MLVILRRIGTYTSLILAYEILCSQKLLFSKYEKVPIST